VRAFRARQKRNFLVTLLLSQGVPMIQAGDEMGRTQHGNNHAYCQDNELSWLDWERADRELLKFVTTLMNLRKQHPLFRRRTFFRGRAVREPDVKDISWLNPDGEEMSDHDWNQAFARSLGVFISGRGLSERDERGNPVDDDDLLLLANAHDQEIAFPLPGEPGERWDALVDTNFADGTPGAGFFTAGDAYPLQGRSLALLARRSARE
jgi:glycogen operon protein